ncbi:hypothetical protein ACOSP7_006894 [Xanthoceras sorbifolium]
METIRFRSNVLVSNLKTSSGEWNEDVIRSNFSNVEAQAILTIPQADASYLDILCWHDDNLGHYSVKIGYR